MEYSENFNVIIKFNSCDDKTLKLDKSYNKENKTWKIFSEIKKNSFDFDYDLLFHNEKNEKVFSENKMERLFERSIIDGLDLVFFSYGYKKSGKTFTIRGWFDHLILKLIQNHIDIKISKLVLDNNSIINIFKEKGELIENNYYLKYNKNINYFGNEDKNQIITILFRNLNKENNLNFTKIVLIDFSLSSKYNKSFTMGNKVFETVEKNNELNNLNKCITMLNDKNIKKESIPFDNFLLTKVLKEYLTKNYLVNFIINVRDNKNDLDLVLNTLAFSQRIKKIPQNYNLNNKKNSLNKTSISSITIPESLIKITESMNTKNNFKKKEKFDWNKELNFIINNANIITRNKELEDENKILKKCKCLQHEKIFINWIKKHEKLLLRHQNKFDIKIKNLIELKKSLNDLINKKEIIKNNNFKQNDKDTKNLYIDLENKKLELDLVKKENIKLINKINIFKSKTINSLDNINEKLNLLKLNKNIIDFNINNSDIINKVYQTIKKPLIKNKPKNESLLSIKTKEELNNIKNFIFKWNQRYINKTKNIISIKNKKLNYSEYMKYNFSKKDTFDIFKLKFENILKNLFSNELFNNKEKYNLILLNIIRELMHSIIDNNIKNEKIEKFRLNWLKKFYYYNKINHSDFINYIKKRNSVKIIEKLFLKYKNKKNQFQFNYKIYKGKIFLINLMENLKIKFNNLNSIIN